MQVTFTNVSSGPVYVGTLYLSLDAGKSVTTRRTVADLERDYGLKALIASGAVTLSFTEEAADSVALGSQASLRAYSNITRPTAASVPNFTSIWNTDDNAENWSDGSNWRDTSGVIT
jgi:hypothetical protein